MFSLTILNTREIKKIKEMLQYDFGFFPEEDYAYLQNEKDKIFVVRKEVAHLDLKKLIVDKIGLYFGELKDTQLRLSKEGAQLLALAAEKKGKKLKNVVTLSAAEIKEYFQGMDVVRDLGPESKLLLLQYNQEILGCSPYKEGKILNFLPKAHRGEVIL